MRPREGFGTRVRLRGGGADSGWRSGAGTGAEALSSDRKVRSGRAAPGRGQQYRAEVRGGN